VQVEATDMGSGVGGSARPRACGQWNGELGEAGSLEHRRGEEFVEDLIGFAVRGS
jgi:hypothetical protein